MNKRYYRLIYVSKTNKYEIRTIPIRDKRVDRDKISGAVNQYNSNTWVSTDKEALMDFAENRIKSRLQELLSQIDKLKECEVKVF